MRILNGRSRDGGGNRWFTVGVSPDIADASFQALLREQVALVA